MTALQLRFMLFMIRILFSIYLQVDLIRKSNADGMRISTEKEADAFIKDAMAIETDILRGLKQ